MRAFTVRRVRAVLTACVLLLSLTFSGCGILPKINTDAADRTREISTESSAFVTDPSEINGAAAPSESEEEMTDPFEQAIRDRIEAQEAFFRFFDEAYDQYLQLSEIDLSDILDMSSEECVKLEEELKQAAAEKKAAVEAGTAGIPEKLPYELTIHGPIMGSRSGDAYKFSSYVFLLKPLAEQGDLSDEEYLEQYPPFLKFGINAFYLHNVKTDGKWSGWKIESFYEPYYYLQSICSSYEYTVNSFYDEVWKQYTELEYTGLQDVMDEASLDYQKMEDILKGCIEDRKTHPELGVPERLGYRIRVIEASLNPPGCGWDEVGTVRFELEPDFDLKEGETEEEKLAEYPAFMEFGEHCWSIHAMPGEINYQAHGRIEQHTTVKRIERMDASPVENASVKSAAENEMEMTVRYFFENAIYQYIRLEEEDLSDYLDISKKECARLAGELKKAKEERKTNPEADAKDVCLPYDITILGSKYESQGKAGYQDSKGALRFRFTVYYDAESWNTAHPEYEQYTEEKFQQWISPPDCLKVFEKENTFSFNWNDGTCKIDGFDASEWFDAEGRGE